jgi:N-acetylglucosamine transport system permease protein
VHHRRYTFIVPFLAPAVLLYATFVLWPYAESFYVALTDWKGLSARRSFVGLANFVMLANDPLFWNAAGHNAELLVVLPIVTLGLALLFATLFTQGGPHGKGVPGAPFFRVVFFFPYVIAVPIVGILFSFIFHPTIGVVNALFETIGLQGLERTWLGDPSTVLWAITSVVVWQAVGFYMVLFVAGIQSIPITYYEAALLDGAGRVAMFVNITLPLLWDHVQVALIYVGIAALDFFAIVQVMTGGGASAGPNHSAEVLAYYMYVTAFRYSQFGYATAMGVSLLLVTLLLSALTLRATRRDAVEF